MSELQRLGQEFDAAVDLKCDHLQSYTEQLREEPQPTSPAGGLREALVEKARPLMDCGRRANHPIGEGKRLVGFVIGEDEIGLGLSEPLFALDALIELAALSSSPTEVETYRQMHDTAKELGYPSILEALEDLERLKASSPTVVGGEVERIAAVIASELDAIDEACSKGACLWEPGLFREISSKQVARAVLAALSEEEGRDE